MKTSLRTSPLVWIFISIASFTSFVLLSKEIVLSLPLFVFVFFYLFFSSIFELIFSYRKIDFSFKLKNPLIHLLLAMSHLGLYYCFFGSLSHLPLMLSCAIYLAYPLFVPFVLRAWMGRKFRVLYAAGIYLGWLGIILSFSLKFKLDNMLIFVALFASLLKAITWVGYHRISVERSFLSFWSLKYVTSIVFAGLLLIESWKPPTYKQLILIGLLTLFEMLSKSSFKESLEKSNPLKIITLFNSSIFILALLDPLFFKDWIPLKPFLCALLIFFGLFFTFLQKNILPNSIYDL